MRLPLPGCLRMRNVIGFTHRASGARKGGPLARPIARAPRAHETLHKPSAFCRDEPGAPAGMLMCSWHRTCSVLGQRYRAVWIRSDARPSARTRSQRFEIRERRRWDVSRESTCTCSGRCCSSRRPCPPCSRNHHPRRPGRPRSLLPPSRRNPKCPRRRCRPTTWDSDLAATCAPDSETTLTGRASSPFRLRSPVPSTASVTRQRPISRHCSSTA
jgi:hypothetical protein